MAERIVKRWLIVRADGSMRVVTRRPGAGTRGLRLDEVAVEVAVTIPAAWGSVMGTIDVLMPEPPSRCVFAFIYPCWLVQGLAVVAR